RADRSLRTRMWKAILNAFRCRPWLRISSPSPTTASSKRPWKSSANASTTSAMRTSKKNYSISRNYSTNKKRATVRWPSYFLSEGALHTQRPAGAIVPLHIRIRLIEIRDLHIRRIPQEFLPPGMLAVGVLEIVAAQGQVTHQDRFC